MRQYPPHRAGHWWRAAPDLRVARDPRKAAAVTAGASGVPGANGCGQQDGGPGGPVGDAGCPVRAWA